MERSRLAAVAVFGAIALAPVSAFAGFHEWEIKEVYSNTDGSIQYIELFAPTDFQHFVNAHKIIVSNGTVTNEFTFPANLAAGSANKHMLLATPGFASIPGAITPDFTLPCGPFIPLTGTITINFMDADSVSFASSALPTDGTMSLTDTVLAPGSTNLVAGTNSPTNYASTTSTVALTTCQAAGTCDACEDALFCNGAETCSAGACQAATDPCNDNNTCTDDTCNEGSNDCTNANRTGSCDDTLFCNGADTCVSGVCQHAGSPCGVINCNEGPETCGDCTGPSDCEDGESCTTDTCATGQCSRATIADGFECDTDATFCNGVGTCTTGICGAIAAPCDPATETCDESGEACTVIGSTPDTQLDPTPPPDDDGCCQANPSLATVTGPALILILGLAVGVGRRRRRRNA